MAVFRVNWGSGDPRVDHRAPVTAELVNGEGWIFYDNDDGTAPPVRMTLRPPDRRHPGKRIWDWTSSTTNHSVTLVDG